MITGHQFLFGARAFACQCEVVRQVLILCVGVSERATVPVAVKYEMSNRENTPDQFSFALFRAHHAGCGACSTFAPITVSRRI